VVVLQESVTSLVGKFRECGPRQSTAASHRENSNQQAVSENVGEILDRSTNKKAGEFLGVRSSLFKISTLLVWAPLLWVIRHTNQRHGATHQNRDVYYKLLKKNSFQCN